MSVYTTEIASDSIPSDNPIHQRLLQAYMLVKDELKGDVLEVGCGEGRGLELMLEKSKTFTAIDKIQEVIDRLSKKYPQGNFIQANIPPFMGLANDSFDTVVTFQVIEHIQDDRTFLKEIYRVLRPGGTAYVTTPNIHKTLTRNPWHIREYTPDQLGNLCKEVFDEVEVKGISGSKKVWEYYEKNRKSVERITRFDVFNLQNRLPATLLRLPYDILNRFNRNKLKTTNDDLVKEITYEDYPLVNDPSEALDLFVMLKKH